MQEQAPSADARVEDDVVLVPQAPRDQIFAASRKTEDFHFGDETAGVFDDMLDRSVPFYGEIQRMIGQLSSDFAEDGTTVYDFGCSTAATILEIGRFLPKERQVRFVGIDDSASMLEIARAKLAAAESFNWPCELREQDLHHGISMENGSVALLVLTLQFLRPLHRARLLRSIHDGLREEGCLILVEKVLGESSLFNRSFIEHYYDFKRSNGYSDLEIAQKREALENVLVPYRTDENAALLNECGFSRVEIFFKWFNFCGFIAAK